MSLLYILGDKHVKTKIQKTEQILLDLYRRKLRYKGVFLSWNSLINRVKHCCKGASIFVFIEKYSIMYGFFSKSLAILQFSKNNVNNYYEKLSRIMS